MKILPTERFSSAKDKHIAFLSITFLSHGLLGARVVTLASPNNDVHQMMTRDEDSVQAIVCINTSRTNFVTGYSIRVSPASLTTSAYATHGATSANTTPSSC